MEGTLKDEAKAKSKGKRVSSMRVRTGNLLGLRIGAVSILPEARAKGESLQRGYPTFVEGKGESESIRGTSPGEDH